MQYDNPDGALPPHGTCRPNANKITVLSLPSVRRAPLALIATSSKPLISLGHIGAPEKITLWKIAAAGDLAVSAHHSVRSSCRPEFLYPLSSIISHVKGTSYFARSLTRIPTRHDLLFQNGVG